MTRARQRLVALALAGLLALNFPVLSLFDHPTRILGVPLLWLYLFVTWGLLICLAAVALERDSQDRPPPPRQGP